MSRGTVTAATVSAGGVAAGRMIAARHRGSWPAAAAQGGDRRSRAGWQVVTVNRPSAEVAPGGRLPEPLARLGDAVEVRLRPAPAGRGTELAARLCAAAEPAGLPAGGDATTPLPGMAAHLVGDDPRLLVRGALREAKQLVETGEVLRPDAPPASRWGPRR